METAVAETARQRARSLLHSVKEHKRAIRFHRERLKDDAAKLAELRRQCERFGIRLEIQQPGEEGELHGHLPPKTGS